MFPLRTTLGALAAVLVTIPTQSVPPGQVRAVSPHWAGYVATGGTFTAVRATWVQPRVRCERPNSSASFWIGLGGATATADGLEQIGTAADCSENFLVSYSAWYELIPVPAAPVQLPLAVRPGDTLSAEVSVRGGIVALAIRNVTTGKAFATRKTVGTVDRSTAEWIAEAPASCLVVCGPLPLADFGGVRFTHADATADSRSGPIDDAGSAYQAMKLMTGEGQPAVLPSPLSPDGRSFSLRWRLRGVSWLKP
jgi:Peptidase A4 family